MADMVAVRVSAATAGCSGWSGWIRPKTLADALSLDMRTTGATIAEADALPDEVLRDAAKRLDRALHGEGPSFRLPFGTEATVGRPGSVEIAGRIFVRRPNAPGLQEIETTPPDVDGPTFESFRLMVLSWASSSNARKIGLPSPGTVFEGRLRHVIEFPPVVEAGGVVLQYDAAMVDTARFCAAPVRSLERLCKVVVKDLQWVWRWRARIAARVEAVREAAEAGIALADHYGRRAVVGRICLDGRTIRSTEGPTLRVEYLGIDDALRRGRLFETVAGHDIVTAAGMMRGPLISRWRTGTADRLRELGADGRIDAAAAAVVRAANEGQGPVLARLARTLETVVALPAIDGPRTATLFWRDGVIRSEEPPVEGLARLWDVVDQRALIDRMAAAGIPLPMEALVDLPAEDPVGAVRDRHPGAAHSAISLVNTTTGEIWPDTGPGADGG